MRVGTVRDHGRLLPKAELEIAGVGGNTQSVLALVDTGFTEWLALPPEVIEQLGLIRVSQEILTFGNLTRDAVGVYEAHIFWISEWLSVLVHQLPGEPAIGMELLRGHRIEFDALRDAEIDVEPVVPASSE